jgi:hypothetical protein
LESLYYDVQTTNEWSHAPPNAIASPNPIIYDGPLKKQLEEIVQHFLREFGTTVSRSNSSDELHHHSGPSPTVHHTAALPPPAPLPDHTSSHLPQSPSQAVVNTTDLFPHIPSARVLTQQMPHPPQVGESRGGTTQAAAAASEAPSKHVRYGSQDGGQYINNNNNHNGMDAGHKHEDDKSTHHLVDDQQLVPLRAVIREQDESIRRLKEENMRLAQALKLHELSLAESKKDIQRARSDNATLELELSEARRQLMETTQNMEEALQVKESETVTLASALDALESKIQQQSAAELKHDEETRTLLDVAVLERDELLILVAEMDEERDVLRKAHDTSAITPQQGTVEESP